MKYEQFENLLDDDLAWRKLEISELIGIALDDQKEVILKSIILLLYAHWEGYIKKCSKLYIKFIAEEKIKLDQLTFNFKAVALKEQVSKCIETKDSLTLASEISFVSSFLKIENKKFKTYINIDNDFETSIVDTQSNLKPKVFKSIMNILGLSYKQAIEIREHYINNQLLFNRNSIGHGSKFDPSIQVDFNLTISDLQKLKAIIFSIMDNFREELLEYVHSKYYLIENESKKMEFDKKQEEVLEKLFREIEFSYSS